MPRGVLDAISRQVNSWATDVTTKLKESSNTGLQFVGDRIGESGRGAGGAGTRRVSGSVIRESVNMELQGMVLPSYARHMDEFVKNRGGNAVSRMNAQQMAGADNQYAKLFNRQVFEVQELRRQGKELPKHIDNSVIKFVDDYNKFNRKQLDYKVKANIKGFDPKRAKQNYIPHIWQDGRFAGAIRTHGEGKLHKLLSEAYRRGAHYGRNPVSDREADELAQNLIDEVMQYIRAGTDSPDMYMPSLDARSKSRVELDTTTEIDGLSILDLLEDDIPTLISKDSNRTAGWVGLSKSTDGTLTSVLDITALRTAVANEAAVKGDDGKATQIYDDMIDMMFGRPTRGGLSPELRNIKDLGALAMLADRGMTQAIETGQVITRNVFNMFSSKGVNKRIFEAVGEDVNDKGLMHEISSMSHISDDIEWLERQSVHLDQSELNKVNKARQLSKWIADKGTYGSLKAPAARLLSKTTGFNAVRRIQNRVSQANFVMDVARHFKSGDGKMSVARLADLGVTDLSGNNKALQEQFLKHVEWDESGLPTKLNFNKWDRNIREQFQYAIHRDNAQQVQRTLVGEMPPWMNKPIMSLVTQFFQMPIVSTNKSLGRAIAFADKEAATGVVLNMALAGMVRHARFVALGAGTVALTGMELTDAQEAAEAGSWRKYVNQFGIYADATDLVLDSMGEKEYSDGEGRFVSNLLGQIPALGLAEDYLNTVTGEEGKSRADAAWGLVPLGNTIYGKLLKESLDKWVGNPVDLPKLEEGIPSLIKRQVHNVEDTLSGKEEQ
jgi:hypothetical protein